MSDAYVARLRAEIDRAGKRRTDLLTEIDHLQAREDTLREALEMYRLSAAVAVAVDAGRVDAPGAPSHTRDRGKYASRFAFIIDQIKQAGPSGLTVAEMVQRAESAGYAVKRNTLRSQLWQKKQKGGLVSSDGRWRFVSEEETESPDGDKPSGDSSLGNGSLLLSHAGAA